MFCVAAPLTAAHIFVASGQLGFSSSTLRLLVMVKIGASLDWIVVVLSEKLLTFCRSTPAPAASLLFSIVTSSTGLFSKASISIDSWE